MQLTLPVKLRDDTTFQNFVPGPNQQLVSALKQSTNDAGEQFIYLFGNPGVGKSHLLQACCHDMSEQSQTTIYLDLAEAELDCAILQDLEQLQLVCLDNIDAVFARPHWEEALMHLYNRMRDSAHYLIVVAHSVASQSDCQLADLRSRLAWGLTFEVKELNDEDKARALQARAQLRGFTLTDELMQFLLRHYSRDMRRLVALLERLDHASLAAQRRLTIPFVKQVLAQ